MKQATIVVGNKKQYSFLVTCNEKMYKDGLHVTVFCEELDRTYNLVIDRNGNVVKNNGFSWANKVLKALAQ